jgi:hypothetical protein
MALMKALRGYTPVSHQFWKNYKIGPDERWGVRIPQSLPGYTCAWMYVKIWKQQIWYILMGLMKALRGYAPVGQFSSVLEELQNWSGRKVGVRIPPSLRGYTCASPSRSINISVAILSYSIRQTVGYFDPSNIRQYRCNTREHKL